VPALSSADVDRMAALAHLELTAEERELFARQLAHVLDYAEQIRQVDTSGVPPTTHVMTPDTVFREDVPRPPLAREAALANAPAASREAGLFKVPRVIGG
jgi:aspartyl-tRNA(Asn)/glutamyl-tRNA(Gln) amidotransferase subunit C